MLKINIIITHILLASANFTASKYDPLAVISGANLQFGHGFLNNHNAKRPKGSFGDISVISLNAHIDRDTLEEDQKRYIRDLIDTHHPTIFALQSISKELDIYIKNSVEGHYRVASDTQPNVDLRTRKMEYKPIIYDSEVLERIIENGFQNGSPNEYYSTFAIFKHKKKGKIFTVINADLFSSDKNAINIQMFNILSHLKFSYYKNYPIFILGTINEVSAGLRAALNEEFKDLIVTDRNNDAQSKNTFHNHGNMNDNLARDFALLKDKQSIFKLNYARILNRFDRKSFQHYPIYAILSFA